jgi:glycerol uptake facilitator protein
MFGRNKIAMVTAEFLGTGILTLVVLAVSKSTIGIPYFVGIAAGLVLVAMVFAFSAVSGTHINPAITLGMWTVRKISALKAVVYIAAQLLGAGAAYLLYTYFVGQTWDNSGNFQSKVLIAETVGTFIFAMGIAAAVYQRYEVGKAAAVIGISLTLGVLVASVAGGGFLNPAVAFGARAWVWGSYVLGPVLGSVIAFNLYGLLFAQFADEKPTVKLASKKK